VAKVVIFGLKDFASLAHFYLDHDSDHEVVAFSASEEHCSGVESFEALPVEPFETIEEVYKPPEFRFFAPMSHRRMNRARAQIYAAIKKKGYELITYCSSKATLFSNVEIGDNCFILEDNTLQPFVRIGNDVCLWSGNHIGHHSVIQDHVFFTSHVVLSGHCTVEPYCFFGVNATIRDGLTIGEGTLVAMSACVTKETEPWGVYKGTPAAKGEVSSRDVDL
jgi:sugar O-acyltransferase (sialic acid O-acetyltransferase NeuD family)